MSEPTPIREAPSSIEISRNARGETQYAVKLYSPLGEEQATLDKAKELYADLEQAYGKGGQA